MKSKKITFLGLVATIVLGVQALNVPVPACMTKCVTGAEIPCNLVALLNCAEKSCDMQDLRSAELLLALEMCGISSIPPLSNASTTTKSTLTRSSTVTLSTLASFKMPSLSSSRTVTTQIAAVPGHPTAHTSSTPASSTTTDKTTLHLSNVSGTPTSATVISTSAASSVTISNQVSYGDSTAPAPSPPASSGSVTSISISTSSAVQSDVRSPLSVRAGVGIGAGGGTVALCLTLLAWALYLRRRKRRVPSTRHGDQFAAAPRRGPWRSDERGWTLFSDHDHTELEDGAVGGTVEELPPYYVDGPFVVPASSANSPRVSDPFASIPRRDSVQTVSLPEKLVSTSGGTADYRQDDGTGGGAPLSSGYGVTQGPDGGTRPEGVVAMDDLGQRCSGASNGSTLPPSYCSHFVET